mgnify:CR=1 FL=1
MSNHPFCFVFVPDEKVVRVGCRLQLAELSVNPIRFLYNGGDGTANGVFCPIPPVVRDAPPPSLNVEKKRGKEALPHGPGPGGCCGGRRIPKESE